MKYILSHHKNDEISKKKISQHKNDEISSWNNNSSYKWWDIDQNLWVTYFNDEILIKTYELLMNYRSIVT